MPKNIRGGAFHVLIFGICGILLCSIAHAAPLYAPGETLNPTCLPSNPDCTVSLVTTIAPYFTATSTSGGGYRFGTNGNIDIGAPALSAGNIYSSGNLSTLYGINFTNATGSNLYATNLGFGVASGTNLYTNATTTLANLLYTYNGNVGIGTATPGAKIAIVKNKGIQFEAEAGIPFSQHTYTATFNGQVDDILVQGYNVKEGYYGDTTAGKINPAESTFLTHLESNVKVNSGGLFTNQHEYGIDFLNATGSALRRPFLMFQQQESPYGSMTMFANTSFALYKPTFSYDEAYPMMLTKSTGTTWFGTNAGDGYSVVTIDAPTQAINQQLVIANAGAYHTGIIGTKAAANALGDTTAWGIFGGENSYLWGGGGNYQAGFLLGSSVPSFNVRFSVSNLAVASGNTQFTVLNNGKVGIGTTSPSAKLDVAGTVSSTAFITPGNIYASGTAYIVTGAQIGGGSAGHAMCWKADGKTLGYCSTVVDASGLCTCN